MTKVQKLLVVLIFLLESFALVARFYINLHSMMIPVPQAIIRYFSYFAVDVNSMVLLCTASLMFKMRNSFFSKYFTQTAIAVYISIVLIIYNFVLRFAWNPQGLERAVNELLYLVLPILFLIYWFIYGDKKIINREAILSWLIFPFVYINYVLICANWSEFYPYPFINIKTQGFKNVLISCIGISVLIILFSFIFLTIGNHLAKKINYGE